MKTNIKQIRKARGLTQAQLAKMIDVSESMVSQYESEKKSPSNETLLKLGEALDCSVSDILDDRKAFDFALSAPERDIIQKYRTMDERGRRVVDAVIEVESGSKVVEIQKPKTKIIPLFSAAAGPGSPTSQDGFDDYEVPEDSKAQFAVRISGDSMEPYLHDGEVVLCKKKRPEDFEMAVIMVNGDILVKQYVEDGYGNIYLRSTNRERKNLDVDLWASGQDNVRGFGTVIFRKIPPVKQ